MNYTSSWPAKRMRLNLMPFGPDGPYLALSVPTFHSRSPRRSRPHSPPNDGGKSRDPRPPRSIREGHPRPARIFRVQMRTAMTVGHARSDGRALRACPPPSSTGSPKMMRTGLSLMAEKDVSIRRRNSGADPLEAGCAWTYEDAIRGRADGRFAGRSWCSRPAPWALVALAAAMTSGIQIVGVGHARSRVDLRHFLPRFP